MVQDIPNAFIYGELDEKYAQKFKLDTMDQINYMSKTIDDFRNFFKPNKQKERFCVKKSVEKAYNLLKDAMLSSNITVEIKFTELDAYAFGYPNEFAQVVVNILSNAKDVLALKTNRRLIIAEVSNINGEIKLSICDNAGGVSEEIAHRIFEPYFTTKDKTDGTGLGLYMSKIIIEENMGGKLSVRNKNEGACFDILVQAAV